jgi:hypothetical protein
VIAWVVTPPTAWSATSRSAVIAPVVMAAPESAKTVPPPTRSTGPRTASASRSPAPAALSAVLRSIAPAVSAPVVIAPVPESRTMSSPAMMSCVVIVVPARSATSKSLLMRPPVISEPTASARI